MAIEKNRDENTAKWNNLPSRLCLFHAYNLKLIWILFHHSLIIDDVFGEIKLSQLLTIMSMIEHLPSNCELSHEGVQANEKSSTALLSGQSTLMDDMGYATVDDSGSDVLDYPTGLCIVIFPSFHFHEGGHK